MEDSHFEMPHLAPDREDALFGVFDGHGGSAVSKFCAEHFPSVLLADAAFSNGHVEEGLRRTYLELDEMLRKPSHLPKLRQYAKASAGGETSGPHPALTTGCTAVVVHIHGNKLTVANSGDSRAVLCRDGKAVNLTVDHKVTLDSEKSRISAAGGVVLDGRENGNLNLTRAIGDLAYKSDESLKPEEQVITANPDVFLVELDPEKDDFVILACDGIWEVMSSQEVVDYVSHGLGRIRGASSPMSADSSSSSQVTTISDMIGNMIDVACSDDVRKTEGHGGDNLSCIVVDLRPRSALSCTAETGGEFVLKPSFYKQFEFRSNSSSSGSSDVFSNTDEYESRIEKLDPTSFNQA